MAIVYKTGQAWATGWTDFGPIQRLSRCPSCAIAFWGEVDVGSREESASKIAPWLEIGSSGMKILGRILGATFVIASLAGPAWAQGGPARYGEPDKPKTPAEIAAEKDAERAYRRSLGNIPEQQKTDPWGTVRSDSAPPKAAAKAPPAKPKAKSAEGAAK
jgi:hypothetical protein